MKNPTGKYLITIYRAKSAIWYW